MFVTTFLILGVFELGNYFPENNSFLKPWLLKLIRLYYIAVAVLSLTDNIIRTASIDNGQLIPVFGKLVPMYLFANIFGLGMFSYITRRKYVKGSRLLKRQIFYIATGLMISAILGGITNLFFVLAGVSSFVALGPSFVLILLSFLFFLLIQGELFNIRIFFGRLSYYALLSIFIIVFYYASYIIDHAFFKSSFNIGSILIGIPFSVIFIFFFNTLNKYIQDKIDSTLISPDYDPKAIIANTNSSLSTVLDVDTISNTIINVYATTIRSSFEGIALFVAGELQLKKGKKEIAWEEGLLEKIFNFISKNQKPIIVDFSEAKMNEAGSESYEQLHDIIGLMNRASLKIVLPLFQEKKLNGVILLGKKQREIPYNSIEIDFVKDIANIASISLARALLYQEVQSFSKVLEEKVKKATKELTLKNVELEESLRKERDMLDILGHELRTPLSTSRNSLEMLDIYKKQGKLDEAKLNHHLDIAKENLTREIKILETILSSSRIDNSRLQLNYEEVDANDVVEDSISSYKEQAEKKGLILKTILPNDRVYCYGDRAATQQIVDNLVSNAIKYTQKGAVTVELKLEAETVVFTVSDTGEGIPAEEIPNLGKKFYRINPYLKSEGKIGGRQIVRPGGTGIGLYVVFKLTGMMNGTVNVSSEVGKGSAFTIKLPRFNPQIHEIKKIVEEQQQPVKAEALVV